MPTLFGENLLDDFFDDFAAFPFQDSSRQLKKAERQLYGRKSDRIMRTDVKETDSGYILAVDLPGFKKEEIQACVEGGCLTISAQKTVDRESGHYLRRERYSGSLKRSFYVGENIRQEDVKAQFKHGVLKLTIPKTDRIGTVEQDRYIAIEG